MKKKLPKFLGYFGHMLLSYASSWSDVNNVRLVQKTKRERALRWSQITYRCFF